MHLGHGIPACGCAIAGMILPLAVLLLAALGSSPAQATRDLAPHTHGVHRTLKVGAELHEPANLSNSVTVVVNFNMHNVVQLEVVQLLHTAYSAAFHRVVFTGQDRPTGLDRAILWSSCEFEWTYFSLCLAYTMAEWPESRQGGYIFVADDSVRAMHPCPDHAVPCSCPSCKAVVCTAAMGVMAACLSLAQIGIAQTAVRDSNRGLACAQIMDPCSMAPLNKTRFWTTELSFFPNVRDDREHSGYCELLSDWPHQAVRVMRLSARHPKDMLVPPGESGRLLRWPAWSSLCVVPQPACACYCCWRNSRPQRWK